MTRLGPCLTCTYMISVETGNDWTDRSSSILLICLILDGIWKTCESQAVSISGLRLARELCRVSPWQENGRAAAVDRQKSVSIRPPWFYDSLTSWFANLFTRCDNQLPTFPAGPQDDDASFEVITNPLHFLHTPVKRATRCTPTLSALIMRRTCIFSGSSHPLLVEAVCERLGQKPSRADLRKFANGETSVEISMLSSLPQSH